VTQHTGIDSRFFAMTATAAADSILRYALCGLLDDVGKRRLKPPLSAAQL
jgi:hypothetical protein